MSNFYTYRQNNSGGKFVFDQKAGLGVTVVIEAKTLEQANSIATDIGIYFNGCDNGRDCDCCGDRWNEPYNEDGTPVPSSYTVPLRRGRGKWYERSEWSHIWAKDGAPEGYVHFLNGKIQPIFVEKVSKEVMAKLYEDSK